MTIWFHEKLDLAALSASGANCMPGFVGIEFIGYGDNWIKARMQFAPLALSVARSSFS